MQLTVERGTSTSLSTRSKVYVDGVFRWFGLEPPVREIPGEPVKEWKIEGKTAIPQGRYRLILTPSQRFSKKKPYCDLAGGRVPELLGVEGFAGIRIHIGNWPRDTEGCLLLGKGDLMPDSITSSAAAYQELIAVLLEAERRQEPVYICYTNPAQ
jgi:hypothetical protein